MFCIALCSRWRVLQYNAVVTVISRSLNSVNKTPLPSQNPVTVSFLLENVYLTSPVCLRSHYASIIWTALSSQHFDIALMSRLLSQSCPGNPPLPHGRVAKIPRLRPSLRLVVASEYFWYPPCTNFAVAKPYIYNAIESWPWNLRKVIRQLRNCESTPFTNQLIHLFYNVFRCTRLPPLTTPIMDVSSSFFKLPAPFSHTAVVH